MKRKITQKGQSRVLKYNIEKIKISTPKKWDKKWRLIIFDIPENKKLGRNILRELLKRLGFCQYQKSVWIYPFDCRNEIDFIKEIYEIRPYVKLVVAEKIDDESKYLDFFGLKTSSV